MDAMGWIGMKSRSAAHGGALEEEGEMHRGCNALGCW